jgi:hypothetical protein
MAVAVGAVSFLVAVYLVNMTFMNEALAQRGDGWRVGFSPASLNVFYQVIAANFGIMKLVFLGIVLVVGLFSLVQRWRNPVPGGWPEARRCLRRSRWPSTCG